MTRFAREVMTAENDTKPLLSQPPGPGPTNHSLREAVPQGVSEEVEKFSQVKRKSGDMATIFKSTMSSHMGEKLGFVYGG